MKITFKELGEVVALWVGFNLGQYNDEHPNVKRSLKIQRAIAEGKLELPTSKKSSYEYKWNKYVWYMRKTFPQKAGLYLTYYELQGQGGLLERHFRVNDFDGDKWLFDNEHVQQWSKNLPKL